jgi:hypothetical protein
MEKHRGKNKKNGGYRMTLTTVAIILNSIGIVVILFTIVFLCIMFAKRMEIHGELIRKAHINHQMLDCINCKTRIAKCQKPPSNIGESPMTDFNDNPSPAET